ncbi:hypothetical protein [Sphingopyxis sp.]|uniref:hypothetical protein n=1 Tax=Sphingopyxis sp. TaxID=1908224 RepID=UPI002E141BB3
MEVANSAEATFWRQRANAYDVAYTVTFTWIIGSLPHNRLFATWGIVGGSLVKVSLLIFAMISALASTADALASVKHPCEELATNSALGEIWPDEFQELMAAERPKGKGVFQRTVDYEAAERNRSSSFAARSPMFAVVSFAAWSDFSYDADAETLTLRPQSLNQPRDCSDGKFCNRLFGYEMKPTGAISYGQTLPSLSFKIAPEVIEPIAKKQHPFFYYVVSPEYPYASADGSTMPVKLHCAALVADEDGSIRDEDDRLLATWFRSDVGQSVDASAQFAPRGCGVNDCSKLGNIGWGLLRVGASFISLQQPMGLDPIDPENEFWCAVDGHQWPDGLSATLDSDRRIDSISLTHGRSIYAPQISTEKGIRIGSSLKEVLKAYPSARAARENDGQTDYVTLASQGVKLLFRISGDRVSMISLGTSPGAELDGCPEQ